MGDDHMIQPAPGVVGYIDRGAVYCARSSCVGAYALIRAEEARAAWKQESR